MAVQIYILSLLVLVAVVYSHPFGFGIEIGGKSQVQGEASAGGNIGVGIDQGINAGARGEAGVRGNCLKSLFGKIYVVNENGRGIGLGGSVGSDVGAVVNGSAAVGADTAILRSNAGARTGLDADGHIRAGGNVHFLNQDELAASVYNARKFTNMQDINQIQTEEAEAKRVQKPKYAKWLE